MAAQTMGKDWVDVLAGIPLFSELSRRHLRKLAGLATTRRFSRYTSIVRVGDRGDAFFVILDGTVAVKRPGRRTITLRAGDAFGEIALLDGAPRTATVEAREDVLAMRLSRTAFMRMLRQEPTVAATLLRTLAGRLRAAERAPIA